MSVENERTMEPPACSRCDREMELLSEGVQQTVPVIGSEVEYRQFGCPECGQGARFERDSGNE